VHIPIRYEVKYNIIFVYAWSVLSIPISFLHFVPNITKKQPPNIDTKCRELESEKEWRFGLEVEGEEEEEN
jgi:hypothetical protein